MNENIINAILGKLCHDLINPIGIAELALEINEIEDAKKSIENALCKIEVLRSVFINIDEKKTLNNLKKYIELTSKNVEIEFYDNKLSGLIFCFLEKLTKKSKIIVKESEILLEKVYFTENEIQALSNNAEISTENIFFYLAYLKYKNTYIISIESKENNSWLIKLKKNI